MVSNDLKAPRNVKEMVTIIAQNSLIMQPAPASSISLLDVVRGVWRRKLAILVFTLLALSAGLGLVKILKPTYSAEALILIESLASPYDRTQTLEEQRPDPVDDRVIKSQMSVLKSQDIALRVVETLKLQDRAEFDSVKQNGVSKIRQLLLALGFGEDPRFKTPQQRALKLLTDELTVYQIPESNVVAVKYICFRPKDGSGSGQYPCENLCHFNRGDHFAANEEGT